MQTLLGVSVASVQIVAVDGALDLFDFSRRVEHKVPHFHSQLADFLKLRNGIEHQHTNTDFTPSCDGLYE